MVVLGMVNMAVCPLALPKRNMEELEELEELKLHGFIMVATLHHRSIAGQFDASRDWRRSKGGRITRLYDGPVAGSVITRRALLTRTWDKKTLAVYLEVPA